MRKSINLLILALIFSLSQIVLADDLYYSSDFSNGGHDGWIAQGGKWKWQKAPVKHFKDGVKSIYVDGDVHQIYLIKSFKGLQVANSAKTIIKLRLKIDSKTPPAYVSCVLKQGNMYVAMNRIKLPIGKWFDWEIPIMTMSGVQRKKFNSANGPITRINLFIIKRDTAPANEVFTMYLSSFSILEKKEKKSKTTSINDWTIPESPKLDKKTLQSLLEENSSEKSMSLNDECVITVPVAILDLANELNEELAKTLKGKLKIKTLSGEKGLFIGICDKGGQVPDLKRPMVGEDDYSEVITERGVLLEAKTRNGMINAIYGLLEGLGYRWYMPGGLGESLPSDKFYKLRLANRVVSPVMKMRFIWYAWGLWAKGYNTPKGMDDFHLWSRRNRIQNHTQYLAYHNFYRVFPKKKYFKTHPEYYSLIKGERIPTSKKGQICATNPDVVRIFAEDAINKFTKSSKLKAYSQSPNDNPYMCQCENCMKYQDPKYFVDARTYAYGYPEGADLHIRMMNQVLKQITKKFPDKYLATIVNYDNISRPPRNVIPDKQIVFGFTTMPTCKFHAINDPNCPINRDMLKIYEAWMKLGNPIYVRDYDPMVYTNGIPSLITDVIAENLKYFASNSAFLGFNSEAHCSWATNTPNFYLKARFGWNRNPNVKGIMDNYFITSFGPAANDIKKYYSLFEHFLKQSKWHPVSRELDRALIGLFTDKRLMKLAALLQEAKRKGVSNPKIAKRILLLKLNFDYLELYVEMLRQINASKPDKALVIIFKMKNKIDELNSVYPYAMVKKFIVKELSKLESLLSEQLTVRKGKDVVVILDHCFFKLDPDDIGIKKSWCSVDSSKWQRISLTAAWEKQGYDYNGIAWYKQSFKIPKSLKGCKLMLYVGALDEVGEFFINGKKIYLREFLTADSWKESFEIDISNHVIYGSDNTIAVRVTDTAGDGGIWKGMFIYQQKRNIENSAK